MTAQNTALSRRVSIDWTALPHRGSDEPSIVLGDTPDDDMVRTWLAAAFVEPILVLDWVLEIWHLRVFELEVLIVVVGVWVFVFSYNDARVSGGHKTAAWAW